MDFKSFIYYKIVYPLVIKLDKLRGLDFLLPIKPEEVGLDPKRSNASEPSSKRFLKKVLSDFTLSSNDCILDVGCGKGSAIRTMLKFPVGKVDGIELSDHIARIANQNLIRLNSKTSKIFNGDAAQFTGYDAYNFIYFYNPFPSFVMSAVINSLIQSIHRTQREVVIIYLNPLCNDVIVNNSVFSKVGIYYRRGNWITIYSNHIYSNSIVSTNKKMQRVVEGSPLDDALKAYIILKNQQENEC